MRRCWHCSYSHGPTCQSVKSRLLSFQQRKFCQTLLMVGYSTATSVKTCMNPWTPELTCSCTHPRASLGPLCHCLRLTWQYYEDLFFNASIVEYCHIRSLEKHKEHPSAQFFLSVLWIVFSYFRIFTEYIQKYHAVVLKFLIFFVAM